MEVGPLRGHLGQRARRRRPGVREFHEPYLAHNARICELLEAGEREAAAEAVAEYLREAEEHLLRDYPG